MSDPPFRVDPRELIDEARHLLSSSGDPDTARHAIRLLEEALQSVSLEDDDVAFAVLTAARARLSLVVRRLEPAALLERSVDAIDAFLARLSRRGLLSIDAVLQRALAIRQLVDFGVWPTARLRAVVDSLASTADSVDGSLRHRLLLDQATIRSLMAVGGDVEAARIAAGCCTEVLADATAQDTLRAEAGITNAALAAFLLAHGVVYDTPVIVEALGARPVALESRELVLSAQPQPDGWIDRFAEVDASIKQAAAQGDEEAIRSGVRKVEEALRDLPPFTPVRAYPMTTIAEATQRLVALGTEPAETLLNAFRSLSEAMLLATFLPDLYTHVATRYALVALDALPLDGAQERLRCAVRLCTTIRAVQRARPHDLTWLELRLLMELTGAGDDRREYFVEVETLLGERSTDRASRMDEGTRLLMLAETAMAIAARSAPDASHRDRVARLLADALAALPLAHEMGVRCRLLYADFLHAQAETSGHFAVKPLCCGLLEQVERASGSDETAGDTARLARARAIAELDPPDSDQLALAERLCDVVRAAHAVGSQLHVQSLKTSIDIAFAAAAAGIDRERQFRRIIDLSTRFLGAATADPVTASEFELDLADALQLAALTDDDPARLLERARETFAGVRERATGPRRSRALSGELSVSLELAHRGGDLSILAHAVSLSEQVLIDETGVLSARREAALGGGMAAMTLFDGTADPRWLTRAGALLKLANDLHPVGHPKAHLARVRFAQWALAASARKGDAAALDSALAEISSVAPSLADTPRSSLLALAANLHLARHDSAADPVERVAILRAACDTVSGIVIHELILQPMAILRRMLFERMERLLDEPGVTVGDMMALLEAARLALPVGTSEGRQVRILYSGYLDRLPRWRQSIDARVGVYADLVAGRTAETDDAELSAILWGQGRAFADLALIGVAPEENYRRALDCYERAERGMIEHKNELAMMLTDRAIAMLRLATARRDEEPRERRRALAFFERAEHLATDSEVRAYVRGNLGALLSWLARYEKDPKAALRNAEAMMAGAEDALSETSLIGARLRMSRAHVLKHMADVGIDVTSSLIAAQKLLETAARVMPVETTEGLQLRSEWAEICVGLAERDVDHARNLRRAIELYESLASHFTTDHDDSGGATARLIWAQALWKVAPLLPDPRPTLESSLAIYEAIENGPEGDAHRGEVLLGKGTVFQELGAIGREPERNLRRAIALFEEAEERIPATSDDGLRARVNHANALCELAELGIDSAANLQTALNLYHGVSQVAEADSAVGRSIWWAIGTASRQLAQLGVDEIENVRYALTCYEKAQQTATPRARTRLLQNRSNALAHLANRGVDPEENYGAAIALNEELTATFAGEPMDRARMVASHANHLMMSLACFPDRLERIALAFRLYEEAVQILPPTTFEGAEVRSDYAFSHHPLIEDGIDLEQSFDAAVELYAAAAQLLPPWSIRGTSLCARVSLLLELLTRHVAASRVSVDRARRVGDRLEILWPRTEMLIGAEPGANQLAVADAFATLHRALLTRRSREGGADPGELWIESEEAREQRLLPGGAERVLVNERVAAARARLVALRDTMGSEFARERFGAENSQRIRTSEEAEAFVREYVRAADELRRAISEASSDITSVRSEPADRLRDNVATWSGRAREPASWLSWSCLDDGGTLALLTHVADASIEIVPVDVPAAVLDRFNAMDEMEGGVRSTRQPRAPFEAMRDPNIHNDLARLYSGFVASVLDRMATRGSSLLFVSADPELAAIPLHAAHDGNGTYAIDRAAFAQFPHAGVAPPPPDASLPAAVRGAAFGAHDPAASAAEVDRLVTAYREQAPLRFAGHRELSRIEEVTDALRDRDVAHFALHCMVAPHSPLLTTLRFSRDLSVTLSRLVFGDEDALRNVRFAFLNACSSGAEQNARRSAITSAAHGFLLAGVRAVLATMWPVYDQVAVELAHRFWDAWWPPEAPQPLRSGPRALQIALLSIRDRVRTRSGSEVMWSPWMWVGDPAPFGMIAPR